MTAIIEAITQTILELLFMFFGPEKTKKRSTKYVLLWLLVFIVLVISFLLIYRYVVQN